MHRKASAFLIAALLGGSATASAPGMTSASYTIQINGFVPVICRATFDATIVPVTGGETALGELSEFCNSPGGYQVYVDSSPELAGATLMVDGRSVELAGGGSTLVVSSDAPAIVSREVSLAAAGAGGSLSFRIVPL